MTMSKLTNVSSFYGAPMGRKTFKTDNDNQKFYLQRLRLDNGGYDSGGAYWGFGNPLYRYESEDGEAEGFLRAYDREDAKEKVRIRYPNAKFFR